MSEASKLPDENQMAKVPWNSYDLFLIFLGTFLLVLGISQGIALILRQTNLLQYEAIESIFALLSTIVQDLLLISLSMGILHWKYKYSIRKHLFKHKSRAEVIINGIFGGVGILFSMMVVNFIVMVILRTQFGINPPQQEIISLLMQSKSNWLFFSYAVLIVFAAPIVEEIFFRGLVYGYLRDKYGVPIGMVISSVIFSLVHMNFWAFAGFFVGSLGLVYLYEKSKSLYTSIIAHMVWNGVVTTILFFTWKYGSTLTRLGGQ